MASWTYSDWQQQSGAQAKLVRLRLHHEEVANKIDAEVGFESTSRSTNALMSYLARIEANIERLEAITGDSVAENQLIQTDFRS